MRNTTDQILNRNLKRAMIDGIDDMPASVSIQGPFFHGTCVSPEDGPFEELYRGINEFEAIWVSQEEWVSEMFANDKCDNRGYKVVYKVEASVDRAVPLSEPLVNELLGMFDVDDPRDLIPHLEQAGYDGWTAMGSVGANLYTDIAIFKNDLGISAMKIFINGDWTEYFSPSDFNERLDGKMESDHLERFTRPLYV